MVRIVVLGLSLIIVAVDAARAQDIAGIEDCTKTSALDKRRGAFHGRRRHAMGGLGCGGAQLLLARVGLYVVPRARGGIGRRRTLA